MDDLIIAAIRQRMKTKVTDLNTSPHPILKPSNPVCVAADERQLGFALPPLMKHIYSEIANGGFGPGYGLIGLTNGVPDWAGMTALDVYEDFRSADNDYLKWPFGLLPICHWGCAIISCVDCADQNFRMRMFNPNVAHKGSDEDDWSDCFFEESPSFQEWITAWASGVNLWTRT